MSNEVHRARNILLFIFYDCALSQSPRTYCTACRPFRIGYAQPTTPVSKPPLTSPFLSGESDTVHIVSVPPQPLNENTLCHVVVEQVEVING